jgi:plasmid stabilization system protein ParE
MAQKIIWSPESLTNLQSIYTFIANDSEYYASLFIEKIISIIENIPDFPRAGRVVPEFGKEEIREKNLQELPDRLSTSQ